MELQGIKMFTAVGRSAIFELPKGATIVAAYNDLQAGAIKLAALCKSGQQTEQRRFVVKFVDEAMPLQNYEFVLPVTQFPGHHGPMFLFEVKVPQED